MRHTIVEFIAHETSFLYEQGFKPKSKRESKCFIKHISENMHYFIEVRTSFGISLEFCFGVKMKNLNAVLLDLDTPLLRDSFWLRRGFEELLNPKSMDELGDDFRRFYFDIIAPFFDANNNLLGMLHTLRKVEGMPMGNDNNHTLGDSCIWLDLLLTRMFKTRELEERANYYYKAILEVYRDEPSLSVDDDFYKYFKKMREKIDAFVLEMHNLDIEKMKTDLGIE